MSLATDMGASLSPIRCFTSDPAPGKTVKDGPSALSSAPTWEIRKKLLAPGFQLSQVQLLSNCPTEAI